MKTIEPMRVKNWGVVALGLALVAMIGYLTYRVQREIPGTAAWKHAEGKALDTLLTWPETPKFLGRMMIERYGPPDVSNQDAMAWTGRYPWKRIIVHQTRFFPLEHVVDYALPEEKVGPVRALGHSIQVNPWLGQISARADREQLNFLALNLAEEIATGRRTPEQAREFYARIVALAATGKSSPYLEGLLFKPLSRADWGWKGGALGGGEL